GAGSVWRGGGDEGEGGWENRTEVATEVGSNGNGADKRGPFLGPDGWLYLCDGRHGHKVKLADGKIDQGLAGGIFRFRTDGSGFERGCGGGVGNPGGVAFTGGGGMVGTGNHLPGKPGQGCV